MRLSILLVFLAVAVLAVVCSPAKNTKKTTTLKTVAAKKGNAAKVPIATQKNVKSKGKQSANKKGKVSKKMGGKNAKQATYGYYDEEYAYGSDDGDYNERGGGRGGSGRGGRRGGSDSDSDEDYDDYYEDEWDDDFYCDRNERNFNNVPMMFFLFIGDSGKRMEPGFGSSGMFGRGINNGFGGGDPMYGGGGMPGFPPLPAGDYQDYPQQYGGDEDYLMGRGNKASVKGAKKNGGKTKAAKPAKQQQGKAAKKTTKKPAANNKIAKAG